MGGLEIGLESDNGTLGEREDGAGQDATGPIAGSRAEAVGGVRGCREEAGVPGSVSIQVYAQLSGSELQTIFEIGRLLI